MTFPSDTIPKPAEYRHKWWILISVGMGIFLGTIDGSIVNIALPTMVRYFEASFALVQWVVLAYLLTVATLTLTVSRLADMLGKKPIYTAGFAVFTLGSLLCGLAPSVNLLILFRILQGLGATMVMSLGMAIITESFPPAERGRAIGTGGAIVSIGIILGPTLGGLIIQHFSWHWIFFVNLPIGLIGILMVTRFVPDFRPSGGQRFDFAGAFSLFICVLSFLLALTLGQSRGFKDFLVLALLASFLLFLVLFIVIERRVSQPMIDLSLFRNPLLSINLVTGFFTFIAMAGTQILMPFYLQDTLGFTAQKAGLMMAIVPLVVGMIAPVSGSLSDRMGIRPITVAGLIFLVVGYFAVSTLTEATTVTGYLLRFLCIGLGTGIFQSPNNSAIMGSAPRERLGIASGMLAITRTLGQTTGIAMLGAIWAARTFYHAGQVFEQGATAAPQAAQMSALHDTFLGVMGMMVIALGLGILAVVNERRKQRFQPLPEQGKSN